MSENLMQRWLESIVKFRAARVTGYDYAVDVNGVYIGEVRRFRRESAPASDPYWEASTVDDDGSVRRVTVCNTRRQAAEALFKDAVRRPADRNP